MGAELWREAVEEMRKRKDAKERELQEAGKELDMFLGDQRCRDARALLLEANERVYIYAGVRTDGCEEDLNFTAGGFESKCTDSAGRPTMSNKPWMPDAIIRNWMQASHSLDPRGPRGFMPWLIGELDDIAKQVLRKTKKK